ncbi:MAG: 3-oxoacyl-[acyl-carrier-protein] reductase [Bacillota bacterium]
MLNGRVALVTGASRGIGRAVALALAEAGADVAVNFAGQAAAAEEVARSIRDLGRRALVAQADVANGEQAADMVKRTVEKLGGIDILVNNAGITRDNLLLRMKEADWDAVLDINLKGAFNCTKAAARYMLKAKWGRVINMTSVVGLTGNPGQVNYAASKAGLIGFTKAVAKELGSRQITCNAVAPGFITTDMTADLPPGGKEKMLEQVPLGRFGQPGEVAALVVFLASEAAGYITGQVIALDGGMTM